MVLTNFECWAHADVNDRSVGLGENIIDHRRNNVVDLFNPTLLRSCNNNSFPVGDEPNVKPVSHLSSNGYYGFSRICHPNSTHTEDEQTAAATAEGDVNITQMENFSSFMDVELHQMESPLQTTATEPVVDVNMPPTSLHFMTRSAEQQQVAGNGNKIRRKRRFDGAGVGHDADEFKRCRFNSGYHRNNDLNDGAYCKAMDHDDILHVANLASFFDGVQTFNQHERFIAPASLDAPSRNSQNVAIYSYTNNGEQITSVYPARKCKRKYASHCDKVKSFQGEMTDPGETQNNDAKRIFSNYKSKTSSDTSSDCQLENLFASLHGGSEWHMPHYFENI